MKVIVGLGNPGEQYARTRHNVGFDVIEYLADDLKIDIKEAKFKGLFGMAVIGGEKVFLLKPMTYMNLSGESVRPLIDFYKIDVDDVLVVYDDLDLPVGKIRLREKGGHGGHNGIRSLISHLQTNEFKRIRVGVDRPPAGTTVVNHVLGKYRPDEKAHIDDAIKQAADACKAWLSKDFKQVMNEYN